MFEQRNLEFNNPKLVRISDKLVGPGQPVFVTAEIGINHNGDMEIVKKMIDAAAEIGCDAVKFQKRTLDVVFTDEFMNGPRNTPWGNTNRDERERLEFGDAEYREIDNYCKEKEIMWFASPWDEASVDFLERYNTPCYKIASASLTDKNLLYKIKETGKPVMVATGMCTMEQIVAAMEILGEENVILMHCTSTYPSKDEELDINVIKTFNKYFNCPIGFSCHAPGVWPVMVAVASGACIVEKHITLGRYMFGWDHAASIEIPQLRTMTRAAKRIPTMLGSYDKKVHELEKPIIKDLRRVDTLLD
ncbi:N-acetylneuraminate synthase [archaeon]|nr:N-acetylneuraminate synthase [archaeon]MBT6606102.1 N-acetylneuraminate synthase [archaeon]MBT7252058.1 N-acetylneuraminate synthase [archaeon]